MKAAYIEGAGELAAIPGVSHDSPDPINPLICETRMDLHVESRPGPRSDPEPVAFALGGRLIQIVQIIDRWIASDHSYFKVEVENSDIYILRFTPAESHWELTLFQAGAGADFPAMPRRNAIQFQ